MSVEMGFEASNDLLYSCCFLFLPSSCDQDVSSHLSLLSYLLSAIMDPKPYETIIPIKCFLLQVTLVIDFFFPQKLKSN